VQEVDICPTNGQPFSEESRPNEAGCRSACPPVPEARGPDVSVTPEPGEVEEFQIWRRTPVVSRRTMYQEVARVRCGPDAPAVPLQPVSL